MSAMGRHAGISVFSTCPPYADAGKDYGRRVTECARWSEDAGCEGTLIYTDNNQLDPWTLAQTIVATTSSLTPLVALQPVYMHPYTVAKKLATFAALYGRRVDLNLVAGGFRRDLEALGDDVGHDRRYERLVEYASIIRALVDGESAMLAGRFYRVDGLRLRPEIDDRARPRFLISGSSPSGIDAAISLGATAIRYPRPAGEEEPPVHEGVSHGIRVGVIARAEASEAWDVARRRFPEERAGQLAHRLAMSVSDSHWHQDLSARADDEQPGSPYWLVPFENYKTFCPYLVGDYDTVAAELGRYFRRGFRTLLLDVPWFEEDFEHTGRAIDAALAEVAA